MEKLKKVYLVDMDTDKRNKLIKKNEKLIYKLMDFLYEQQMFNQQMEGEEMFGDDYYKYISIEDNYDSFYLVLKNWEKFIKNLNADYIYNTEAINLYNNIIKKQEKLYNMDDVYSDDFYELDEEIEKDCKKLLSYCEKQLHEYEKTPEEDDAIQYADEMEQLEGYYIEEYEEGKSDDVIRYDVSYTETFI